MRGIDEAQVDFSIFDVGRRKIGLRFLDEAKILEMTEASPRNFFGPVSCIVTEYLTLRTAGQKEIERAVPGHEAKFDDRLWPEHPRQSEEKQCFITMYRTNLVLAEGQNVRKIQGRALIADQPACDMTRNF